MLMEITYSCMNCVKMVCLFIVCAVATLAELLGRQRNRSREAHCPVAGTGDTADAKEETDQLRDTSFGAELNELREEHDAALNSGSDEVISTTHVRRCAACESQAALKATFHVVAELCLGLRSPRIACLLLQPE
jgi:hypothetical protein